MNSVLYLLNTTFSHYQYFNSFLPIRSHVGKCKIAVTVLVASVLRYIVAAVVRSAFQGNLLTLTFVNGAGSMCILLLITTLFIGRWYVKGFLMLVFTLLVASLEMAITLVLLLVQGADSVARDNVTLSGWAPIVSLVLLHIITISIKFIRGRKDPQGNRDAFLVQMIVPAVSILYTVYLFNEIIENSRIATADWASLLVFAVINLSLFFIFQHIESMHRTNHTTQLAYQRLHMQQEYYKKLEIHQKEIRTIKHDLKNKLLSIQGYIENTQRDEAMRQVETLMEALEDASELDFSRHAGLNALLGAQYLQAQRDGIECQFDIHVPEAMHFASEDLCALIGNLLDNAYEACICHKRERYIQLTLAYHNHALIVKCENSTDGMVKSLSTGKPDSRNHGLGFASMQAVVAKYGGDMEVQAMTGFFRVEATLFENVS